MYTVDESVLDRQYVYLPIKGTNIYWAIGGHGPRGPPLNTPMHQVEVLEHIYIAGVVSMGVHCLLYKFKLCM